MEKASLVNDKMHVHSYSPFLVPFIFYCLVIVSFTSTLCGGKGNPVAEINQVFLLILTAVWIITKKISNTFFWSLVLMVQVGSAPLKLSSGLSWFTPIWFRLKNALEHTNWICLGWDTKTKMHCRSVLPLLMGILSAGADRSWSGWSKITFPP